MTTELITAYLDRCSQAYYCGHPIISDQQFDQLADSIGYRQVGYKPGASKAKHLYQMFSLQKHYKDQGKPPLDYSMGELSCTVKLDGAAISLLYIDGRLARAITRGDGVEGQCCTDKLWAHTGLVPKAIDVAGVVQVTGEIVAPKTVENSRNYAAGALNLKSVDDFKTRALSFFAYGIQPMVNKTYDQDLDLLAQLGFNTVAEPDLDKIYPTDGVVFRVLDNEEFYRLGYTAKHPRGAYAQKERAEWVESKLLAVEWQVGKTGKVTPVAILEPVMIGDALVSRATLNNPGFIEALGLCIGDLVAVARAGEIIPCILHKINV
jgi:DNA ligase (NAD+)